MRLSKSGIGNTKLSNIDQMYPGQSILLQTGQIVQYGAGIFAYNNIPLLVKRNLEKIIQETLNKYNCIEVLLPILQPEKLWKDSGRYEHYIKDGTMLITKSNKGDFCLAPTAEEAMMAFAREKLKSYKSLPVVFYQIGEKVRNEIRTRGYLLRGKQFPMLDAYSFDKNEDEMIKSYLNLRKAFLEIFEKIEMPIMPIVADNGAMGGKRSEEFMIFSSQGEDTILFDETTGIGLNTEILEKENYEEYLKNEYGIENLSNLKEKRTMELAHIFQLGTKYSETMNGYFTDAEGNQEAYYMGCYGIGVSRTVAAIYEQNVLKDKNGEYCGFALPKSVAPYILQIIPKIENKEKFEFAMQLYDKLNIEGIKTIIDDREKVTMGTKIKDSKILGTPYIIVIGHKQEGENLELENVKTGEVQKITINKLIETLKNKM